MISLEVQTEDTG